MRGIVRNPVTVLLLSIITCGIYLWFWLYTIGSELKLYLSDEGINPGFNLVLSILCFPYLYYIIYRYSQKIYQAQLIADVPGASDNSLAYTIIGIFLPVVSAMLMQSELNKVW